MNGLNFCIAPYFIMHAVCMLSFVSPLKATEKAYSSKFTVVVLFFFSLIFLYQ